LKFFITWHPPRDQHENVSKILKSQPAAEFTMFNDVGLNFENFQVAPATKSAPERFTCIVRAHPKVREFEPLALELTYEVLMKILKSRINTKFAM